MYYRGAHGALVVLDVTSEASFHAAKEWVTELRAEARPGLGEAGSVPRAVPSTASPANTRTRVWHRAVLMLVCNKVDLAARRVVSGDRCAALARSVGALCVETSAKDDVGVGPAFYDVAVAMLKRFGDSDAAEAGARRGAAQRAAALPAPSHPSPAALDAQRAARSCRQRPGRGTRGRAADARRRCAHRRVWVGHSPATWAAGPASAQGRHRTASNLNGSLPGVPRDARVKRQLFELALFIEFR